MSAMSASELETGPEIAVLQPPPSLNSAVAAVAGSRPALVLRPGKMHAVGSRLAHARQWIVLAAMLLVISCSTGATACDPFSTCFDVCSVLFVKSDNGRFVDLGLNGRYVLLPPLPFLFLPPMHNYDVYSHPAQALNYSHAGTFPSLLADTPRAHWKLTHDAHMLQLHVAAYFPGPCRVWSHQRGSDDP